MKKTKRKNKSTIIQSCWNSADDTDADNSLNSLQSKSRAQDGITVTGLRASFETVIVGTKEADLVMITNVGTTVMCRWNDNTMQVKLCLSELKGIVQHLETNFEGTWIRVLSSMKRQPVEFVLPKAIDIRAARAWQTDDGQICMEAPLKMIDFWCA